MSALALTPAQAVEIACIAKTRVLRGGARARSLICERDILAMAMVLDVLLSDHPAATRAAADHAVQPPAL